MHSYVCVCGSACVDRVGSVLGLLINPWARAVLHSQTDRLSPVPAPVTGARSNKPLQRDRASRNVRFRTRGSEKKSKRARETAKQKEEEACVHLCVCVCVCCTVRTWWRGRAVSLSGQQRDFAPIWTLLTQTLPFFFFLLFFICSRVKLF